MSEYAFLAGPYFLGSALIAFILAIISIWWSRHPFFKVIAFLAAVALVLLNFKAVDNLHKLALDNLSRPKFVTFSKLQDMLPDGHPGHLVLYGEANESKGIYLLLRTPNHSEPRYYLMAADKKQQEQFKDAQLEAKNKKTQLLLGGKRKSGRSGGKGKGAGNIDNGEKTLRGGPGFDRSPKTIFHPAPVSGGPEKNELPQDRPIQIPTPHSAP